MKKLKQDIYKTRGITLIALVVTIVVLLILAAVSINMLTGENGIIRQAQEAKKQTKIGEEKDGIAVAYSSCKAENLGGEVSDQQLEDQLIAEGKDVTVTTEEGKLVVTYNDSNRVYTIDANGKIEETVSNIAIKLTLTHNNVALDASTLPNVKEVTSENVPIPEGFYYVGGSKDTGVVISDVEGDNLDNTAQGNQFVWIPVDQNQVLTLEVTSKEDITGITLTHPDGTQENITASGKTYNGQITKSKNGVYEVEVTTATSSKMASKRITSLYAQDLETDVIYRTYWTKINATEKYSTLEELLTAKSSTSLDELLTTAGASSIGEYMLSNNIFVDNQEEEFKRYVRVAIESGYVDNNQNLESVEKYGGYYIGRYEAGDGTTSSSRTSSTSDSNTLVSKKGAYVYNWVDWETSRTLASTLTTSNVTGQLITGAGWDRALNWIIETGGKTENEVICDSRSWGNYYKSTGNAAENSGSSNMNYTTGRSEYWKANNIYDMAGNTWEWTQEQYDEGSVSVYRGGFFFTISGGAACIRYSLSYSPTNQINYISFRPQLYIK